MSILKVAIQGERGSFSEEAAVKLFPENAQIFGYQQFEDVFRSVLEGVTDTCLIPIENSLAGSIHRNYDLLLRHKLKISREIYLRIEHNLIACPGVVLEDVRQVLSHPVALDQCHLFFEKYPHLERKVSHDTSGSVRQIMERHSFNSGAIAGRRAAQLYGAAILKEGIEDNKKNFTRFVLMTREMQVEAAANKTSVVFSFQNVPGALFKSLSVFALRDIDLTKIESRPIHGRPWEYLFYVDFLGRVDEGRVQNALNHLQEITDFFEVLGCYPGDESIEKKRI